MEAEFLAAPNGGPAAVHAELRVDALRVRADSAQPDDQLVGDTRAIKVGREQPKDIKLPLAERLHEILTIDRPTTAASEGAEQASDVLGRDASLGRRREHLRHGGALAHERSNVALRLCQRQRATERLEPCGAATALMLGQRLQDRGSR